MRAKYNIEQLGVCGYTIYMVIIKKKGATRPSQVVTPISNPKTSASI